MASSRAVSRAFTLIELLIVVAIIAILAAIAVPNFLEAQTRAKASRAKSDLRTIVTALESYAVDANKYPPARYEEQVRDATSLRSNAQFVPGGYHFTAPYLGPPSTGPVAGLSSPIAYISSATLKDPFVTNFYDELHNDLGYQSIDMWCAPGPGLPISHAEAQTFSGAGQASLFTGTTAADLREKYGFYIVRSLGPDKIYDGVATPYDPTNGSVSSGDIYRTQKRQQNNRSIGGE